ncbi:S-layer homology domain-containing protein [Candidatus Peregrinibacteria bacterium]|nr:S-layer homology domain-containing protein [Candidatus Peregrinibacteria bacterium]
MKIKKLIAIISLTSMSMVTTVQTAFALGINYQATISSVVMLNTIDSNKTQWVGSGFIMSNDAIIVTAAHVVIDDTTKNPMDYIDICLIKTEYDVPDCKYSGKVLAYNTELDLALVYPAFALDAQRNETGEEITIAKAQTLKLPYVDFADKLPTLGDPILILGYPITNIASTITSTKGSVSGFTPLNKDAIWTISTDATINPGNSGGPAYNGEEKVIGVVDAVSTGGIGGNYGYIISNDIIYLWFQELVKAQILTDTFVNKVFANDYVTDSTSPFTDITLTTPHADAITYLKNAGIISGYTDGSFKPTNELNRAELLKILIGAIGETPDPAKYKNCFPDVKEDWYAKYVCFAKEKEWIKGYPDGSFKPANNINKAEALKMLLEVFQIKAVVPAENPYNDVNKDEWFSKYIGTAKNIGILEEKGKLYNPSKNIKRGEISENIYRVLLYLGK